jgi:hypothetical protein
MLGVRLLAVRVFVGLSVATWLVLCGWIAWWNYSHRGDDALLHALQAREVQRIQAEQRAAQQQQPRPPAPLQVAPATPAPVK